MTLVASEGKNGHYPGRRLGICIERGMSARLKWISQIPTCFCAYLKDDIGLPLPDDLCARVLALYETRETNGVLYRILFVSNFPSSPPGIVTLKSKNPDQLPDQENIISGTTFSDRTCCEFHISGEYVVILIV